MYIYNIQIIPTYNMSVLATLILNSSTVFLINLFSKLLILKKIVKPGKLIFIVRSIKLQVM